MGRFIRSKVYLLRFAWYSISTLYWPFPDFLFFAFQTIWSLLFSVRKFSPYKLFEYFRRKREPSRHRATYCIITKERLEISYFKNSIDTEIKLIDSYNLTLNKIIFISLVLDSPRSQEMCLAQNFTLIFSLIQMVRITKNRKWNRGSWTKHKILKSQFGMHSSFELLYMYTLWDQRMDNNSFVHILHK